MQKRRPSCDWTSRDSQLAYRRRLYQEKKEHKLQDEESDRNCVKCNIAYGLSEFLVGRNICRSCREFHLSTVHGRLQKLLYAMKHTALYRKGKGRENAGTFNLTFDDLLEIYQRQNGNCYYFTSKELSLDTNSEWMISRPRRY